VKPYPDFKVTPLFDTEYLNTAIVAIECEYKTSVPKFLNGTILDHTSDRDLWRSFQYSC